MKRRTRNPHASYCGEYLHKECRVSDCECMCHTADEYGVDLYDLLGLYDDTDLEEE